MTFCAGFIMKVASTIVGADIRLLGNIGVV